MRIEWVSALASSLALLLDPAKLCPLFSPNFKFSYDFTPKVAGGLEYYGSVGPVTEFDAVSQQQHQVFPAIDLNIAPQWEINFGLGVGLTGSTDNLIAKIILGYRFNF